MKEHLGWKFPDADVFMVGELKANGTYQSRNLHEALRHVRRWRLAIDCGAHVGTWSRLMSAKFAQIIAVEPAADTYACLVENLRTFGCANVESRHLAVGAKAHEVRLVLDGRGASMRNTGARHVVPARSAAGEVVHCEPIDEWQVPDLDFLKMDIEGSEVDALQGAQATIRRCQPVILFENKQLWRQFGHRPDAPQRFLSGLGYRLAARVSCDEIWVPR